MPLCSEAGLKHVFNRPSRRCRGAVGTRDVRFPGRLTMTLLMIAALSLACRDGAPRRARGTDATSTPSGIASMTRQSVRVGTLTRSYWRFMPASVANHPEDAVSLVIGLHGGLGTGEQFASASRFNELAAEQGFIVAYPDGVGRTWNGGSCCGEAVRSGVDDVAFIAAMIEDFAVTAPIDRRHVFITGHSNGAIMAFRFACERADLVAAVVPVAGSLEVSECHPSRGVPLLAIHGDADRNHPLQGGTGSRSIAGVPFRSMADSLRQWTAAVGCADLATTTTSGPLMTTTWLGCRDGVAAQLMVIAGADHPWPGSHPNRVSRLQGQPTTLLDATKAAWGFFKAH